MNRPRPGDGHGDAHVVETDVAVVTLVDRYCTDGLAKAFGRERVELTRTRVNTIAVDQVAALNFPGCHYESLQAALAHTLLPQNGSVKWPMPKDRPFFITIPEFSG